LLLSFPVQPLPPMPLQKRRWPFDDPNYVFELKYDGFRALAVVRNGVTLISRNGHPFASFTQLADLRRKLR
jgi:bifunctional non-homologous end joining protein LigD